MDNKARFSKEVHRGDLIVSNRKRCELLADLMERGYNLSSKDEDEANQDGSNKEVEDDEVLEDNTPDAKLARGYEYLLGMKIWSLTFERAKELRRQHAEKAKEVTSLEALAS